MIGGLLRRMRLARGESAEPETIHVADLPAGRALQAAVRRKLVVTDCAAPRAFYDAPALATLPRAARLKLANALALELPPSCPPYYTLRNDEPRDVLYLGRQLGHGLADGELAVEVELLAEGGRVRDVSTSFGGPATARWLDLAPDRVLDLDHLLRRARFWDLPATDGKLGDDETVWHLSRLERTRQHLVRRVSPSGDEAVLFESLAGLLADELQTFQDDLRRRIQAAPVRAGASCTWPLCKSPPTAGDPSRLCADHRRRVDAQGQKLRRKRG
jgi:hypothetical protein